jgi:hypothetical protein
MLHIAFIALIALQSPPSSDGKGKSSSQQSPPIQHTQIAAPVQQPAETTPIQVQRIAPASPEPTSAWRENRVDSKTMADWWLVGFTGALVFVSWLQWRTLKRHAKHLDDLARATKTAAEAASTGADATMMTANALKVINQQWLTLLCHLRSGGFCSKLWSVRSNCRLWIT